MLPDLAKVFMSSVLGLMVVIVLFFCQMKAPSDFQPQLVNTSSVPYAAPPAWLRSQRFPGEETFAQADRHAMEVCLCVCV